MKEMYGVFKKFIADNHHDSFAKALNSAYATENTRQTLKVLHDEFGHYAQLAIHKDICYVIQMYNPGGHNDDIYANNMCLSFATFPLERALADDFDYKKDVTRKRIGGIGDTFAGHKSSSGFCPQSLVIVGDLIYVVLGFENEQEKQFGLYVNIYDTNKQEFIDEYQLKLDYKGKVTPFNYESMNDIYKKEGYPAVYYSQMQVSHWSEYKGEYYSTIIIDSNNESGIIFKTKDFKTIEYVEVVHENLDGCCEDASYIFDGKMYIACRQKWTTPYLIFIRYDLEKKTWTEAYKIEDGNSRPMFFEYHDELFLFNTLDEPHGRHHANISKVRTAKDAHKFKNAPINTIATLFECGDHHCYAVYNDRIFFTATKDSRIYFGELKLKQFEPKKVNQRLLELFGDVE